MSAYLLLLASHKQTLEHKYSHLRTPVFFYTRQRISQHERRQDSLPVKQLLERMKTEFRDAISYQQDKAKKYL